MEVAAGGWWLKFALPFVTMRLVRWGLAVGSVPIVFAATMVVPEELGVLGMGPALGCSAGGNVPEQPPAGFTWLQPSMLVGTDFVSVPVGTDGFFAMEAQANLSAEAALEGLTVEVRDEVGELVAGRAWVLTERQPGWYLVGWEASLPLDLGATLTATLLAEPIGVPNADRVGGDFRLEVVSEPAALPEPSLSLQRWVGYFQGQGQNVTCTADEFASSCGGPETLEVPASYNEVAAAWGLWELANVPVGVVWEARLEASGADSDALLPGPSVFLATESNLELGLVVFPTAAEQHCVTLITRDLRTDDEARAEFCDTTQEPTHYETDAVLLPHCLEPPTETSTEAWCRLHRSPPSECGRFLPGGAGSAGAPANGDDEPRRARTSEGCQLSGAASGNAGPWLALAALVALRRRR